MIIFYYRSNINENCIDHNHYISNHDCPNFAQNRISSVIRFIVVDIKNIEFLYWVEQTAMRVPIVTV